jgi:hypothetical protein
VIVTLVCGFALAGALTALAIVASACAEAVVGAVVMVKALA